MTTLSPPPQYVVHAGDALRERETVQAIWRGNLGQQDRMAAKYDWFYLSCPHGPPLLQLLRHASGDWVGTACAGRRRMRWQGRDIAAGVLVDLAVLPEHRSLGPALILQQGLIEAGARQVDLLYGFPNPKAAAVFKRIGYSKLTEAVRYARVLRHRRYFRERMPAWLALPLGVAADFAVALRDGWRRLSGASLRSEWRDHADPRMDALWAESAPEQGLVAIRDSRHVKWRFDESPLARTRYLLISASNGESLFAWFATQEEGATLHIRDFWSRNGAAGDQAYVLALLAAARTAGYASVSVEIAGTAPVIANWSACGFVARGRRPVFGRWSGEQQHEGAEMFLTSADEDE
ncbi:MULTISPECIES: hypothetical protein [unclassified Pseudoxanthomonas]|uniref:hypothetical protein n=1 Tax=unclassified Pseudoxanthomonas TaxID=2645906 RepID=UPI003077D6D9